MTRVVASRQTKTIGVHMRLLELGPAGNRFMRLIAPVVIWMTKITNGQPVEEAVLPEWLI